MLLHNIYTENNRIYSWNRHFTFAHMNLIFESSQQAVYPYRDNDHH